MLTIMRFSYQSDDTAEINLLEKVWNVFGSRKLERCMLDCE
jgi:hypothetical protein